VRSRSIRIALIVGSLGILPTVPAFAQSSQQFNLGAEVDVCNTCDLNTQSSLAQEDDRHDEVDSEFDAQERNEDLSHDQIDQSIEQHDTNAEDKQNALADENERHQNALTAIERNRAIEAARHQQALARIMEQAGKLLSDLTKGGAPGVPNGGNPQQAPNGGAPQQPGGSQSAGSPPAGGGQTASGSPISPGNGGGGNSPPGGGGVEYPGGSPGGVPQQAAPGNPAQNPGNGTGHGPLKGLNDFVNNIAQKMQPPPSYGTGQPYTGPLAINGHSPLYYANEAVNSLANSLPGGSNSLQGANQAATQFANQNFRDQWTQPMSPAQATTQVATAFGAGVVGKGLGAAGGVLKNSYTQALTNGAGKLGALRAASGSLGAAKNIGLQAAKQEAATLSGFANAGGSGYTPVMFSDETPPSVGQTVTKFETGQAGNSVKSLPSNIFNGQTWENAVQDIGNQGGGWKSAGAGKWVTNDGQWTATQQVPSQINPANPNGVPMIFLENTDGGVIRIKPMGVPQGNLASMQNPHYAFYQKINPTGGTGWDNEAFKVVNGTPVPKAPSFIEPPAGMPKYSQLGSQYQMNNPGKPFPAGDPKPYYSEAFNNYLDETGWTQGAHQPLAGDNSSWNAGMFMKFMRSISN
jgi:hypothetical protein